MNFQGSQRGDAGKSAAYFAGIELGGTKCVCTLAGGPSDIIAQETIPTSDPQTTLSAIDAVLDGWWQVHGFAALGIASFGPVDLDPTSARFGYITSTSKPGWRDTDVARRLSARFPVAMAFDTDVNGAALAEMEWGAGRGLTDFAYVTVGTGVGVGLVVRGKSTRGISHCELGHIRPARLPGDDWEGACPYHGDCVEGLASGSAIKARLGSQHVSEIEAGHPLWQTVAHALSQLCHVLICSTGPQRIVFGGGVIERQPHLLERIRPLLEESLGGYMPIPEAHDYISAPELGDAAGPLGPIALALSVEKEKAT